MPLQANKQNHQDKKLARRDIRKKKKIQDFSQEKAAPKTTKQTVTLTTVARQKVQEKSLDGTYRLYTKKNLPRNPSALMLS